MASNFLTGREYLRRKKVREKKKLISVALGFPDLVFAVGAVPVFPIRLETFEVSKYLMPLQSATSVLGWSLTSKFLEIARQFDVLKIVDKILEDVITSINSKYNEMYEIGVSNGVPSELCYGINALYGMHKSKGKSLDANLNFAMRCGSWNTFSESLKTTVPHQIIIDIPSKNSDNEDIALKEMVNNVKNGISELEKITGNFVSDNSLQKQFRIGNQVKRFYKTILYEISDSNFYPCNPATFAEILALLTITFQDYNSNAQRYLENLSQLVKEMRERIRKGIGMDVSHMPRLLFAPMYQGWEPEIHEIIYKLGGRIIYADWDVLGFLEEIPISHKSDPIEEYARFLLNASTKGIGCDDENMTNSYLKAAENMNIDGLIFNQVYGCPSISKTYERLKEKLKAEYNIPAIVITFKKIGENIEQVRKTLIPFMERLKDTKNF
ncbi:MAG TPA: 2-hydroxyacyl-CoA dehydratase family protein [Candidatus Nanopelagicaceae bacterium]|nr:2-hydroxyacyl-CoA dehydratase family protein [Candidatus Nanopelagicaceae bacterium]